MAPVIRTVGHSNRTLEVFLEILAGHRVETLVDVRSVPWSRRWPWFRKRELAHALRERGVDYLYQGGDLGGRPGPEGPVPREAFEAAVSRMMTLARESRLVLMCAEADPGRCHRSRLLAPAFLGQGARVVHLLGPEDCEEHDVTQARMTSRAPVMRDLFD